MPISELLPFQSPFIFLLVSVLFLIALLKTDAALIVLIFSMLFSPEFSMGGIPGRAVVLRIDDILLFVVFFGWLARMAIHKELGLLRATPLNRPILTYIFIGSLATLLGALQGQVNIKHSFFYFLKYIEYFLLFFMVANHIRNLRQAKIFVFFLLLTCLLVSLYAMRNIGIAYRVTAPFEGESGEPNTLAGYLLLLMAIIMGLLLYAKSDRLKFIFLGLLAFVVPPFLFTLSRGAWLGFFPMYLALIILSKRGKTVLWITFLVIAILSPLIVPHIVKKRVEETFVPGKAYTVMGKQVTFDYSSASRIEAWKDTVKKWIKRPLLGYGIPVAATLDNQYARVLQETGIIGLMAFTWLMVMIWRVGWRSYNASEGNDLACGLSLGFMAGFIGLLTQALTTETFIIVRIMEPFWFFAAIIVILPEISASQEEGLENPAIASLR